MSRYRDEPSTLGGIFSAWVYVLINAGASAVALLLTHVFGWTFGAAGDAVGPTQVLVASFAALAFFRSSLFTVRVGDTDVSVGPAAVLTTILGAVDRDVDRHRAEDRSAQVVDIMGKVSFEAARFALPTYALGLMQNVPLDEQAAVRTAVDALTSAEMSDRQRSLALGLLLLNVVGGDVLKAAVKALESEITA